MSLLKLFKKTIVITTISLTVTACGGGGGEQPKTIVPEPPPAAANIAPVISDMSFQSANEREEFSFTASASDSDGTVTNMSWVQKSGIDVPNASFDKGTISFIAPAITEEQTVVFTFLATDDDGAESTKDLTITIKAYKNISDVYIPDASLKGCIDEVVLEGKEYADVGIFGPESMLLCENKGVSDLTGLEEFERLELINLSRNNISSLEAISNLENIKELSLSDNELTSLSNISKLTKLTSLSISNNQLTSIEGMPSANGITHLDIHNNQITSLTGLPSAPSMTFLDISDNLVTDLNGIESFSQLNTLYIHGNPLSDISSIPSAENVRALQLSWQNKDTGKYDMPLKNIDALKSLTGLESLIVKADNIHDISALASLVNLKELVLIANSVTDISALSNLIMLEKLTLSSYTTLAGNDKIMEIKDLSPLSSMSKLKELKVKLTAVEDFNPISSLVNLNSLWMEANANKSFAPFVELTNLVDFKFYATNSIVNSDIDSISKLSNLKTFHTTWPSDAVSLDLLHNMPLLEDILIGGSISDELADFSALEIYKYQLSNLIITGTKIDDVSFLSDFKALKELKLLSNKYLYDLTPLKQLTELERLSLLYNDHIQCTQIDELENALVSTIVERPENCL